MLRHLTRLVRFKQILTLVCLGLCESCCGFYDAFKSKNTITSTRAIRQSEAVTAVCWAGILLVCCGSSLSLWHGHPTVMCTNDSLFIPLGVVRYSWEVLKKIWFNDEKSQGHIIACGFHHTFVLWMVWWWTMQKPSCLSLFIPCVLIMLQMISLSALSAQKHFSAEWPAVSHKIWFIGVVLSVCVTSC